MTNRFFADLSRVALRSAFAGTAMRDALLRADRPSRRHPILIGSGFFPNAPPVALK